jgi:hypothetical protein
MHRQFPLPRLIYPRVRGETSGQCLPKFLVAACTAANEPATEAAETLSWLPARQRTNPPPKRQRHSLGCLHGSERTYRRSGRDTFLAACTAANKDTDDSDGAHIGDICSGL